MDSTTKTVVVKVGSSSVTADGGAIDRPVLARIAADVAQLAQRGWRVAIVTSGAITAGWAEVGEGRSRPRDSVALQAVSAVGQPLLMDAWRSVFAEHDRAVGQVLLAPLDFANRTQYLHARTTLDALWRLGVVPIINENDAVADEEIRFGDNDRLAALVANMIQADRLILLTDTPGLLTADPRHDPSATLIEEVRAFDDTLTALAKGSSSGVGSGGMASKLSAARMATWSGVETVIAAARADQPVARIVDAFEGAATKFVARDQRLSARKAWIAFASAPRGHVVVNEGALSALRDGHRSLLGVGVTTFAGEFHEGDTIEILDTDGRTIAKGIAECDAAHVAVDELVVHRDNLVLFA